MKIRTIAIYAGLFLAAFIIFLVVLFPRTYIADRVSQNLTFPDRGVVTEVKHISFSFPFSLVSNDVRVKIGQYLEFVPDKVKIQPGRDFFFGDTRTVRFFTRINQGAIDGSVIFSDLSRFVYTTANVMVKNFQLNNLRYVTSNMEMTFNGKVDARYQYNEDTSPGAHDPGKGTITVTGLTARSSQPILKVLKLSSLNFSKVLINFTQDKSIIYLSGMTARGKEINLNMTGVIQLGFPINDSRLSLNGNILPDSPFLKKFSANVTSEGIPFTISGTLAHPEVSI